MLVNAFCFVVVVVGLFCCCCCFWLRFSRCCCLNGSLYIYIFMFRITLKDFLSIIGSINTWVPIFSLSPFVHAIVIWTVSIVAASSHLLCVWFRHTLTVLASIICNHSACLSSVFVYMYISLCNIVIWILRCSSCIWTIFLSSPLFKKINNYVFLSSGFDCF